MTQGGRVLKPAGYARHAVLTAAITLETAPAAGVKLSETNGAVRALMQARAQAVSWRDDGGVPTAAEGLQIAVGQILEYDGDLSKFQFIEVVAGGALIVSFYGI
jgi:hypothetical protein